MAYKIDFGMWGSVFAVPTSVVDKGLKLASENQLKVLLYVLRNSDKELTDESVGEALSLHADDVRDALEYWKNASLLVSVGENLSVAQKMPVVSTETQTKTEYVEKVVTPDSISRRPSRVQKPEPAYINRRMKAEPKLVILMDEASRILGKVLSSSDTATLVMLHDTDGLPVEVLLMLMEYAVKIGKGNMRYIERTGMKWSEDGINTIELAEQRIRQHSQSTEAFNVLRVVFGLSYTGSPTKNQLQYADTWINQWHFTEDMLRLAYEKCVDNKGQLSMSYINGILRKWKSEDLRNTNEVEEYDQKKKTSRSTQKGSQEISYDLDLFENTSIFD